MSLHTDSFNTLSGSAEELLAKLESFRHLNENWDSYNAAKPSEDTIERACTLVRDLDRQGHCPDFIASGPNGEVMVELIRGERSVEVYFNEDGSSEYVVFDGAEAVCEFNSVPNVYDLVAAL